MTDDQDKTPRVCLLDGTKMGEPYWTHIDSGLDSYVQQCPKCGAYYVIQNKHNTTPLKP